MAAQPIPRHECDHSEPRRERGSLRLSAFALRDGSVLEPAELAWQAWGSPASPTVIVLGGISAGRDIGTWWGTQCGLGRALDPTTLRLVSIDWLGGCDGSTGPRADGAFPAIDSLDQAHAILALLNHLAVSRVEAIVGASYGGCVAQHLAALLGTRLRRLLMIGCAHRAGAWALALRHLQRAGIVAAGTDPLARREALKRARQLAVLGYRTAVEVDQRFGDETPQAGVLGWLDAHAERFVARFDAESFLRLSASLDAHACAPETIVAPTTVVSIAGDLIVPSELAEQFVRRAGPQAQLLTLASAFGHDAFLKETDAIARILRDEIAAEVAK